MAARKLRDIEPAPPKPAFTIEQGNAHHEEEAWPQHHKKSEEGEGPWLVSYADMMTLLMGFFALISSLSKPDMNEFEKVKQSATEYFGGEYERPYQKLEERLRQVIKENQLEQQVKLNTEADGLSLTFTGTFFFDSGSFIVKPEAQVTMDKMVQVIRKEAGAYNVMIEGHTDSRPMSHQIIASNWELSGIRAARVAQLFENRGFLKKQLTIMGWGETKPLVPNENADGSPNLVNQSKNRRVVIKILKSAT